VLVFHICYVVTTALELYFLVGRESEIPTADYNLVYLVFTVLVYIEKITFQMANWTFSFKYWIVSLTLRQALSANEIAFSEKGNNKFFYVVTGLIVALVTIDTILYYQA